MAELSAAEKHAISHRGRAARMLAAHLGLDSRGLPCSGPKRGAAGLSIASNATLIAIKLAAGAITGSIAIITEAIHSLIDLVASVVAYFSVRKADEPADAGHPYGHEKVENLAAAIEGMLILLGAAVIVYEATHQLVVGASVDRLGVGIAVMAFSVFANLGVSSVLSRQAKESESQALEGDASHLRTDAMTSAGVLFGLALVQVTGNAAFDPITALVVAVAIVWAGLRILRRSSAVLVDEALPAAEMDRIEQAIAAARTAGGRRLPQAARPPRRRPPPHRLPRPVPLRHQPRARARAGARDARLDRGRDPAGRGADPRRARDLLPPPRRERRRALPLRLAGLRAGQQVDRGGEADGDQRDRVAGVAAEAEEDRGDRADRDDGAPGGSGQGHGSVFSPTCPTLPLPRRFPATPRGRRWPT